MYVEWCVPVNGLLQSLLCRIRSDQQQDCHRSCHWSYFRLQRQTVWYNHPHLEGSKARPLVARARIRGLSWVLALFSFHPLGSSCYHGAIWRRSCQHATEWGPLVDPDGQWPLPRRRSKQGCLFSQPPGGWLGQQSDPAVRSKTCGWPSELLRH